MPPTEAQETAKTMKLAAMDWALCPLDIICQELKVKQRSLSIRRLTPVYLDTLEEIKKSWREKMLATPGTNDIRKQINYGLSIAVKKLVGILSSSKTAHRDIISAARLIAQMDGRFIGAMDEEKGAANPDTESLATELIQMIKRTRETVQ